MSQAELMLIDTHGSRPEALRELRRLTGRSLAELNALLWQLPCAIERGEPEALLALATSASSVLELQIWEDGGPSREHVLRHAGTHVEQRVAVEVGSAGVRFRVDDVDVATSILPTRPELEVWAELGDGAPAYHPVQRDFVTSSATLHPLVGAIQLAFDQHRPLRLTPDAVWLTIAAGFAQHVNTHAQALRERFVRHDGRKTLTVEWHGSLASLATDLAEAVASDMGEASGACSSARSRPAASSIALRPIWCSSAHSGATTTSSPSPSAESRRSSCGATPTTGARSGSASACSPSLAPRAGCPPFARWQTSLALRLVASARKRVLADEPVRRSEPRAVEAALAGSLQANEDDDVGHGRHRSLKRAPAASKSFSPEPESVFSSPPALQREARHRAAHPHGDEDEFVKLVYIGAGWSEEVTDSSGTHSERLRTHLQAVRAKLGDHRGA